MTEYENPDLFFFGDSSTPDPSGFNFLPGGGQPTSTVQDIFLGVTGVAILASPPDITSISPTFDVVGSSGQLTISGSNLLDIFTQQAMWSITGSGVSLTAGTQADSQVVLNYSIALNATTGDQRLTLSSHFGASNPATFHIGDPSPIVTSVTPNIWNAGETTSFTLTGTGFGTNPSLTITGPGVTNFSIIDFGDNGQPNGATIHASVTVDVNSPGGDAIVEVTSHGYNGTGFLARKTGDMPVANNKATIDPVAAPPPQIMYQGKNISGQPAVSPYAGQQIVLSVTAPSGGFTIIDRKWEINPQDQIIGGYDPTEASGSVTAFQLPNPQTDTILFYAIAPENSKFTVAYTYTLKDTNGNTLTPPKSTATFTPTGPKGVNVSTVVNKVQVGQINPSNPVLHVVLGNPASGDLNQAGIKFTAQATSAPKDAWHLLVDTVTRSKRDNPSNQRSIF